MQALNAEERGIWFEILMLMHDSEQRGKLMLNGKPYPIDAIANIANSEKAKVNLAITKILTYGVAEIDAGGFIFNRRMLRDESFRMSRVFNGKKGGRPKTYTKPSLNLNLTPSSSSSSSSSSSTSNTPIPPLPPKGVGEFNYFWESYPKKIGKGNAYKVWVKSKNKPALDVILAAIEKQKQCAQWQKESGQFIPNPSTWLSQGRWDDEVVSPEPEPAGCLE